MPKRVHPKLSTVPSLMKEWDPQNSGRQPDEITLGAADLVGWICSECVPAVKPVQTHSASSSALGLCAARAHRSHP